MTWLFASDEKKPSRTHKVHTEAYKNEQMCPEGAVLLGVLKSIEIELCKRELLGAGALRATPLWFLAETERNVFLWRSGKSIDDHRLFSFWVDVRALLVKRREQLARNKGFNPFINPMPQSGGVECEVEYLEAFEEICDTVMTQAAALSKASEEARFEVMPDLPSKRVVILPHSAPASAAPPG
jgi:hypothetical protein